MKKYSINFFTAFVLIFYSFSSNIYAFDYELDVDSGLFPIQPSLLDDTSYRFVHPGEMTSLGVSASFLRHHSDIRKDFWKTLQKLDWLNDRTRHIEIKLEVPSYEKYNSLGVDVTLFFPKDMLRRIEVVSKLKSATTPEAREKAIAAMNELNKEREEMLGKMGPGSYFTELAGFDVLGTYKLKYPFYNRWGDFILAGAVKMGVVFISGGEHISEKSEAFLTESSLGGVAAVSLGCDYYFSPWLGVFAEFSLKGNYIVIQPKRFVGEGVLKTPYAYTSSGFSVGFKTTF